MKNLIKSLAALAGFILIIPTTFAYSGDLSINQKELQFSSYNFLEGKTTRIYSTVTNHSQRDLLGIVRFTDNGAQIGADQPVSVFKNSTDGVFIDFTPSYGNHKIAAKVYPWDPSIDDPSNNWVVAEFFAIQDTDRDGIPNESDPDDDNDQVNDTEDDFPLDPSEQYDTDGDGKGDNADLDDDNDEVPDEYDDLPLDPNETLDTDKDGIGNTADKDDDNDGLSDTEEENLKTDPLNIDTDTDGISDKEDAFPLDTSEWLDTDGDKIGNNIDTDDDNDGTPDNLDAYPLNKGPVIKLSKDIFNIGLFEKETFDASSSIDEDGKIVSYIWQIGNDANIEGNSVTHTFVNKGKQKITLTVTDDMGESVTKQFEVNVINQKLYLQMGLILLTILLALTIFFKYIAEAKNSKASKQTSNED